jgi:hypothetical protein
VSAWSSALLYKIRLGGISRRTLIGSWPRTTNMPERLASLEDPPRWPEVRLGPTGQCVGCEREGRHRETYTVQPADVPRGKQHTCSFAQAKWTSFQVGSQWKGRTPVPTGDLDCSSLLPAN